MSDENYGKTLLVSDWTPQNDAFFQQYRVHRRNRDIDIWWFKWGDSGDFEFHRYVAAHDAFYILLDSTSSYHPYACWYKNGFWVPRIADIDDEWDEDEPAGNGRYFAEAAPHIPILDPPGIFNNPMPATLLAGTMNFGNDLGTQPYIARYGWWGWIGDRWAWAEKFYYVKHWGWVRWEEWNLEGQDPVMTNSGTCNIIDEDHERYIPDTKSIFPSGTELGDSYIPFSGYNEYPNADADYFYITGPYLSIQNAGEPGGGITYPTIAPARAVPSGDPSSSELFTIECLGGNLFAIRTESGYYLTAVNGGGAGLVTGYEDTTPGDYETFTAIAGTNNHIAFLCHDGVHYIRSSLQYDDYPLSCESCCLTCREQFGLESQGSNKFFIRVYDAGVYGPEFLSLPEIAGLGCLRLLGV